jgi:iron complex outermembrane receptor protein
MGHQHFINSGVYLQYRWQATPYWAYTLNGRYDDHNLYGDSRNYRLGVTGQLLPQLAWKLLYGTSYKAPSAAQLYAQPLTSGDVIGNPRLSPETASFWESQLSWQPSNRQLLEVSAYRLQVDDKIEVLPVSFNLQPQNRGRQQGWGVEAEWRAYWRQQMLQLQGAWQDTEDISQHPFFGEIRTSTASYPRLQCRLGWTANTGDWGNLAVSARYASPRRASSSNINASLGNSYQLPGYSVWRLHWFKDWQQHRLSLSIDNLFNHSYAEAGYGGIDLPGQPRQLTVGYQWTAP